MLFIILIVYCIVEKNKGVKSVMKKYIRKGISLMLVLSMSAWCMAGCGTTKETSNKAQKSSATKETTNMEALLTSKVGSAKDVDKDETVYVEMDPSGKVTKTTVSDVLKVKGKENISDVSDLKDIVNLSGDEGFARDSDKLVWENKGKTIKYQGTTTKEAPIGIDVKYYLDDKEISPDDLKGKSGKVKIVYSYNNKSKDSEREFIPFIALTGMILDKDVFSNITIDNGKVIDYDDSKIVVGYGAPGLKDHLLDTVDKAKDYISDIEIPEGFTLTADVKNFEMDMTLTAATSGIGDMDLDDTFDFSDIDSKMDELQSGTDKLVNGTSDLNDGAVKLKDGSVKIVNGTKDLEKYTLQLFTGSKTLYDSYKLFDKSLMSGVNSANDGAVKLYNGTKDVKSASSQLDSGAKQMDSSAKQLNSGAKQIASGVSSAKAAFEDSKDKDGKTKRGLKSGAEALAVGTKNANAGIKKVVSQLQSTPDSIQSQIDDIIDTLNTATGGLISSEKALNTTVEGINSAVAAGTELSTVLVAKGLNTAVYYKLVEAYYSVRTLESVKSKFETQIKNSVSDIKALTEGMDTLEEGSTTLANGIGTLYTGISTLNSKMGELTAGTTKLTAGTKTLADGTRKLKTGADTLNNGMKSLTDGTKQMKSKLGDASPKLLDGIKTVKDGSGQISNGASTLASGSKTLGDGIITLADGTKTLKDGAIKLNKDGISKITDIFGKDAKDAINKIEDTLNAGKDYKSFSGINEGMDGSVKFIFKTAEIKADK